MSKSFSDWLHEGEDLYKAAFSEYQQMEQQIEDLERRLLAKQQEVNQIASIIGKPPVEGNRRLSAQIVEHERNGNAASPASIARALTGGRR